MQGVNLQVYSNPGVFVYESNLYSIVIPNTSLLPLSFSSNEPTWPTETIQIQRSKSQDIFRCLGSGISFIILWIYKGNCDIGRSYRVTGCRAEIYMAENHGILIILHWRSYLIARIYK
jgi:hypothetical protein